MGNKISEKIELLAPAGNYQSFMAAINGGADAIYRGLSGGFNARGNIENFTTENLKETVEKAHLFGVKIYLTLNTLIKDEEIEDVLDLVRFANECKVDAFIVQDIGLANLLFQKFKNIELHASTQMGASNLEGVKFLEGLGFKRVVLARETPLSEIRRIKDNTNVDIEYFIQGALCVGFSGNCYLCSLLSGASGNRGKCKQFCRLGYKINGGKEGYYLSTKDFCMLPSLKELIDAGVTSLKIEGRARRPAYVASAVQTYRKVLENELKYSQEDITNLKKVFNRGDYISGYFKGEKIIYSAVQNHIGIEIGKILDVKKGKRFNEVILSSSHKLRAGDTLKLFDGEKEVMTVSPVDIKNIGKNKYLFTTTASINNGMLVRLIVDSAYEEELLGKQRKIDFSATMTAKIGKTAILELSANGIKVKVESEEILSEAKSQPLSYKDCKTSLSKSGDEFELVKLDCKLENVFFRKGDLNNLRREGLSKLREALISSNEKQEKVIEIKENLLDFTKKALKNNKKIVFFDDYNKINDNNIEFDYFVYSPSDYKKDEIKEIARKLSDKKIFLDLPLIATSQDISYLKEILKECDNLGVYVTNYYGLNLTSPDKTIIGSEMNIFNSLSVSFYKERGFDKIVLSKEDFLKDEISAENVELFVDERLPRLIYFKHCPFKEHFNSSCNACKYKEGVKYSLGRENFALCRKRIINCHFYLKEEIPLKGNSNLGKVVEI